MRDHFVVYDPLCVCVRNGPFKAVSYCYEDLTGRCCLWLYQDHDSVVKLLGTYAPVQTDPGRIFCRVITFQIRHSHDCDLIGSRVVEGHQHPLKILCLRR